MGAIMLRESPQPGGWGESDGEIDGQTLLADIPVITGMLGVLLLTFPVSSDI
jgi:hypothetical protein